MSAFGGKGTCGVRCEMAAYRAGRAVLVCPFTAQSHAKPFPKGWGFCIFDVRYWGLADIPKNALCVAVGG